MFDHATIKDQLAAVTSDLDQAQAALDDMRRQFPNDRIFQEAMDKNQFDIDIKRKRIEIMREIANVVEP